MSKFNILAKLGFCVAIPSLALIFYILTKRKEENFDEGDFENSIKCRQTIIEVRVPAECVRSLIGPQGSVVKQIQQKTDTRINYKDRGNSNGGNAISSNKTNGTKNNLQEEIFLVRGSSVNVQRAEIEIKRLILDMGTMFTEEYYVPDYVCGRLIGRGGSSIKEITNASNCKIKIQDRNCNHTSKQNDDSSLDLELLGSNGQEDDSSVARKHLSLNGTTEQIARAKELILAKIAEENMFRERRKKNNQSASKVSRNDFDRYNKNDRSSSYVHWSDSNLGEDGGDEPSMNQIVNMPKLISLESYLDENKSVDVVVSAVANPCVFWVQIVNKNGENKDLTNFTKRMNAFYNNNNNPKTLCYEKLSDLKVGMLIACQFDNKWYRGEVKGFKASEIDSEDETNILIDLYIVDFGDSSYLHLNEVKFLAHEFYDFPMQAVECIMHNMKLNNKYDDWTDESINYFEEITYSCKWKSLKLEFVEWGDNQLPSIKLFDPAKNAYISDMLILKEYIMTMASESNAATSELIKPITLTDGNELINDNNENTFSNSSSSSYTE